MPALSTSYAAVIAAVKADPGLAAAIAADPAASVAVSREAIGRDLRIAGDKLAALARKFQTPEEGHGEYRDSARIVIEGAIAKIRAAVQHIEDVMNGAVDNRIPDDLSGLDA